MVVRFTESSADVIVVGAGLAGLAAATSLQAAGRSVTVLEASDGVGGRVRSDIVDGFTLDRGFQVLLTAYPEAHRQLDLAALDLRPFDPGAVVWKGGRGHTVADPFRAPRSLFATAVANVGSPLDKLRVALLRRRLLSGHGSRLLGGGDVPTIDHLRQFGFSEKMIATFFRPLFAGIQLDTSLGTSRRMFDIIFRCLATGDSAVPAAGMGAIPAQLAGKLADGTVHLGARAVAVRPCEVDIAGGGTLAARSVVVAVEGPVAASLLPQLRTTPSLSVGCVYFQAPTAPVRHRSIVLDGGATGPAINVAPLSNVATEYAPAGQHLIAAATPGDIGADLDQRVRRQLRGWWGSQVDSWSVLRVDRIAHAQPSQLPPFSPKQSQHLDDGLWVCGDHRDTASIQGALFSGRRCAEAVLRATT
jgi:phytoene dehydrogenase-like protein